MKNILKDKGGLIILVLILLIGGFLRTYHLDSAPPGLYPDEAINANQGLEEAGKLFYPDNHGREGLFINLLAVSFKLFGVSVVSARLVPAIFGTLTILGIYLLSKELFNERVALLSAFLFSLSFWHINFSRILFRAILAPFCLTYAFYFFFRGNRKKNILSLVIAGLFYGLGFHTYLAYRLTVLLLPFLFLPNRKNEHFIKNSAIFLGSTFIAGLPIGIYFLKNPNYFMARTNVGVQNLSQLLNSSARHLLQFFVAGDPNWRHNISTASALFWPTSVSFLVGLIISVKKAIKKTQPYPLLLAWWLILLLPGALTFEGIPHQLRTLLVITPVFIMAGLGAEKIIDKGKEILPEKTIMIKMGVILFTLSLILSSYLRYFDEWAKNEKTEDAFFSGSKQIAEVLSTAPPETKTFVLLNQEGNSDEHLPLPTQSISFLEKAYTGEKKAKFIFLNELETVNESENTWIVPIDISPNLLTEMKKVFPNFKAISNNKNVYLKPI